MVTIPMRNHLRREFNKRSSAIAYGRDRDSGQIVRLPRSVEEGDWYDDGLHKGHLACGGCNAPIHFNKGSDSVDGSRRKGASPHFKLNANENHEAGCTVGEKAPVRKIDYTAGFRLNHNTSTSDYYRPVVVSIIPQGLEPVSIKGMNDVAHFMRTQDIKRIVKSFAVFRDQEAEWKNYMFSDSDRPCRKHLVDTVLEMLASGKKIQLACFELLITETDIKQPFRIPEKTIIPGKRIKLFTDEDGMDHILMPRFSVDKRMVGEDDGLVKFFDRSGTYMAQGLARLSSSKWRGTQFYFLEMPLVSMDQVMKTSLDRLLRENRLFHRQKLEPAAKPA